MSLASLEVPRKRPAALWASSPRCGGLDVAPLMHMASDPYRPPFGFVVAKVFQVECLVESRTTAVNDKKKAIGRKAAAFEVVEKTSENMTRCSRYRLGKFQATYIFGVRGHAESYDHAVLSETSFHRQKQRECPTILKSRFWKLFDFGGRRLDPFARNRALS